MVRVAAGILLLATLLCNAAVPICAEPSPPRIRLSSCVVSASGEGNLDAMAADLRVRFENESTETLKTIVWRAQTPVGTIDFTSNGTFSPQVSVYRVARHRGPASHLSIFVINRTAFDIMGPGVCSVIQTVNAAGEVWQAPGIAPPAIEVPPVPSESAAPVPPSFDNPQHNPIGIISCQFNIGLHRAAGYVRFRNLSSQKIDRITFRAYFGEAGLDFVLQGAFSPGVVVRAGDMTRRELPPNAYQEYVTLETPTSCVAVSAHYADGTLWENPSVPAAEPPFPVGVP